MNNKKLIPKGQEGLISKLLNGFIGAAMAENPAVMTAAGWKQNKEGTWELTPDKDSKLLAENLTVISGFSPTNPTTAIGNKIISYVPTLLNTAKNTASYLLPKANIHTKNWSLTIPHTGEEDAAFRLIAKDAYEDAMNAGILRPQTYSLYNAKVAKAKQAKKLSINLVKQFNNVMFNRKRPFYGNPLPFSKHADDYVIIGKLNNPKINWRTVNHKGHKDIVEPTINGEFIVPSSEFEFWRRAPLNFGWVRAIK